MKKIKYDHEDANFFNGPQTSDYGPRHPHHSLGEGGNTNFYWHEKYKNYR